MFLKMYRLWIRCRAKAFTLLGRGAFYRFGTKSVLVPPIRLGGERFIAIGKSVFVGQNSWIEVMQPNPADQIPVIDIGDETAIAGFCTITAVRHVVIEPRVLIARNVYISDHSHAFEDVAVPIMYRGLSGIAPVSIGRETWLGQNVVVLPGVTIGKHCVIGANSVVNSSIPDFSVAVGAPARVIKRYNREAGAWERVKEKSGSISC